MWLVGNGQQINIREDKWLKRGIIGGLANAGEPKKVDELIDQEESTWKELLLQRLFDVQVVRVILTVHIRPQMNEDKLIWTGTKEGDYTVKSGYNTLRKKVNTETQPTQIGRAHV